MRLVTPCASFLIPELAKVCVRHGICLPATLLSPPVVDCPALFTLPMMKLVLSSMYCLGIFLPSMLYADIL